MIEMKNKALFPNKSSELPTDTTLYAHSKLLLKISAFVFAKMYTNPFEDSNSSEMVCEDAYFIEYISVAINSAA